MEAKPKLGLKHKNARPSENTVVVVFLCRQLLSWMLTEKHLNTPFPEYHGTGSPAFSTVFKIRPNHRVLTTRENFTG